MYLPAGVYHEHYRAGHTWWQTAFVRGKMAVLLVALATLPLYANLYLVSVANIIGYTILSALGVQLLIGYCGQITLGHAAFIAVGAYATSIGLLHWGARSLSEGEPSRYESAPAFGILGRLRDALRSIFP